MRLGLLILLLAAEGLPAQAADPPSVALPAPLERVLRDYERHWPTRSADSISALFTEDGMALPSGRMPIIGRPAIAERYAPLAGGSLRLRAMAYAVDGSVGYIVGGYRYGQAARDEGKFVLAIRRDSSGRWLVAADIDNANARPEAGAPGE
jgi:ketosteroid isomerase-like protein